MICGIIPTKESPIIGVNRAKISAGMTWSAWVTTVKDIGVVSPTLQGLPLQATATLSQAMKAMIKAMILA